MKTITSNKERHDLSSVLIISVPCKIICILAPLKVIFWSFCHEPNNKIDDDQMTKEGNVNNGDGAYEDDDRMIISNYSPKWRCHH